MLIVAVVVVVVDVNVTVESNEDGDVVGLGSVLVVVNVVVRAARVASGVGLDVFKLLLVIARGIVTGEYSAGSDAVKVGVAIILLCIVVCVGEARNMQPHWHFDPRRHTVAIALGRHFTCLQSLTWHTAGNIVVVTASADVFVCVMLAVAGNNTDAVGSMTVVLAIVDTGTAGTTGAVVVVVVLVVVAVLAVAAVVDVVVVIVVTIFEKAAVEVGVEGVFSGIDLQLH